MLVQLYLLFITPTYAYDAILHRVVNNNAKSQYLLYIANALYQYQNTCEFTHYAKIPIWTVIAHCNFGGIIDQVL